MIRAATSLNNPSELALGSASLTFPVGNDGLLLNLDGSYTNVNPRGVLENLGINGCTVALEAGLTYPIVRSRKTNISVKGSFDYADSRSESELLNAVLSQDRLAVLRFAVQFDNTDSLGAFQGSFQLSQGVGGTETGTTAEPLSRAAGSAVFTKINLKVASFSEITLRQVQVAMLKDQVRVENNQLVTAGLNIPLSPKLQEQSSANLTHPYYWSGITMVGNPW